MDNENFGMPRGWGELIKLEGFTDQQSSGSKLGNLLGAGLLKKIIPFALAGIVLLGGVAGVSRFLAARKGKAIKSDKQITLTYWGLWEPNEVMRETIAEWEKSYPNVKINYVRQLPKEYRERLQSALARVEGPDIFRFHASWLAMLKNDLEPVAVEGDFYPVINEALKIQNQYYGLPLGIDVLSLYYNKAILQTLGENPPTTWEEARGLAKKITETYRDNQRRIQVAGLAMGITSNVDHWPDILGLMMLQNGADLANPTGNLAEDALTYYSIFYKQDKVWDETLPSSALAFAGEKLAMFFGYSWDAFEIKKANPDLNFGIAEVPQLDLENKVSWASFWAEGVAKKSKYKAEAWEFLKFLSSKEILEKMYQAASKTRLFGEPYPKKEMAESLAQNPLVRPFVEQADFAKTWYLCSRTFDNGLNDRMIKYFEDGVNAVVWENKQAKDVLPTVANGVKQLLTQYGVSK